MRIKIHGDNQRQKVLIRAAGRAVTAWLTLRALRMAKAAIAEHEGSPSVLVVQEVA